MPGPKSDGADGAVAFGLWAVEDPDAVLDLVSQEEYEQTDERMPYFAMLWDSGEALAAKVLAGPSLQGHRVLDLGCGLGPCGLAAAARGGRVTFFDWEQRALEIVAASARQQPHLAERCDFVVGDWRNPPRIEPCDLILAADVLYERRNVPAVAAFLAGHLKPGAEAWVADPGRINAQHFPGLVQHEGLELLDDGILLRQANGPDVRLLRLVRPGGGDPHP
jgi:predicted nicotinamide N-methyase